jgi:MYXO-CTERM domain-containing protein
VLLASQRAQAEPEFPGKLRSAVPMQCTPGCGLCHIDPSGGGDRNPWGNERGVLVVLADVATQLAKLPNPDFDHDGTSDVDELRKGSNPGVPGPSSICIPEYGCGARLARTAAPPEPIDATLAAAALFVALGRRRRRERTR